MLSVPKKGARYCEYFIDMTRSKSSTPSSFLGSTPSCWSAACCNRCVPSWIGWVTALFATGSSVRAHQSHRWQVAGLSHHLPIVRAAAFPISQLALAHRNGDWQRCHSSSFNAGARLRGSVNTLSLWSVAESMGRQSNTSSRTALQTSPNLARR